jgi:hypothetical protein
MKFSVSNVSLISLVSSLLLNSCTTPPVKFLPNSNYIPQKLLVQQIDLTTHKIKKAAYGEDFIVDCYSLTKNLCVAIGIDTEQNDHRTADAGLRLFLVENNNHNIKIRYRSKGSNGSYILSPTFFKNSANNSWVILAETGAEYTDGVRTFVFDPAAFPRPYQLMEIGKLNVGVEEKYQTFANLSSVVPHTKIDVRDEETIIFSFTQDVVFDPGGQNEQKISQDKIRYIYKSGQLQEVIDQNSASLPKTISQPTEHPDRIIQSKKVQGRFIKSIWGDYLYSFVGTKSGEIQFMINSDESCFLRQHRQSELSIDYDIVDRYIPQASGYGHYNIIRNVQSKKTNLATWLKSVTKKELDQCEKQDQADTARGN